MLNADKLRKAGIAELIVHEVLKRRLEETEADTQVSAVSMRCRHWLSLVEEYWQPATANKPLHCPPEAHQYGTFV